MRKMSLVLIGALAAALPLAASANELSYRYAEGGYQHIDGDGADANGGFLRGAYELGDSNVYVLGGYRHLSTNGYDLRPRQTEVGVGYHHDFSPRVHGLGELAYQHNDTRLGDYDGFRASAGVRGQFSERWEGLAKVNFYDKGDYRSDTTGTVGVQYRFTPRWGVTSEVEFDGDNQAYLLGVRASF